MNAQQSLLFVWFVSYSYASIAENCAYFVKCGVQLKRRLEGSNKTQVQALIGPNFTESANLSSLTQQIWTSVDGDEISTSLELRLAYLKSATEVHVRVSYSNSSGYPILHLHAAL